MQVSNWQYFNQRIINKIKPYQIKQTPLFIAAYRFEQKQVAAVITRRATKRIVYNVCDASAVKSQQNFGVWEDAKKVSRQTSWQTLSTTTKAPTYIALPKASFPSISFVKCTPVMLGWPRLRFVSCVASFVCRTHITPRLSFRECHDTVAYVWFFVVVNNAIKI